MDANKCWHAGKQTLMKSKIPELCLVFHFVLGPFARHYSEKLYTGGGFGQHVWTPAIMASQLQDRKDHLVDMEAAMSSVLGGKPTLQSLSANFQNTFRIPHGILVQSDQRWLHTTTTAYWNFTDDDRKAWCLRMNQDLFDEWNELASPIAMAGVNNNSNISITGVERVVNHFMSYPGQIFAVRTKATKLHHPSCRSLEKLYGDVGLEFKDLLASGNPMAPDMEMWGVLRYMQCCGRLWCDSFLHWAIGEHSFPPKLKLMTVSRTSNVWRRISEQKHQLDESFHCAAKVVYDMYKTTDVWIRYAYLKREINVGTRLYRGDVFQPLLFSTLCDKLNLWGDQKPTSHLSKSRDASGNIQLEAVETKHD
jgi:hypothetical protein